MSMHQVSDKQREHRNLLIAHIENTLGDAHNVEDSVGRPEHPL
jgi:hypothetical protein